MKINNFSKFLESYIIDKNDSPNLQSQMISLNKSNKDISEYNSKKSILNNIYLTYKDQKDLRSKLKSQGFTNNTGGITFINPLLSIYSRISEKSRKIKNIEESINLYKNDIIERNKTLSDNPELKDNIKEQIDELNNKIANKLNEIKELNKEILDLEKEISKKLKEIKDSIIKTSKEIGNNHNK